MNIDDDDLEAAIEAGVIGRAEVERLQDFAAERRLTRLQQAGQEDERFRFMRGFNDFFFAIGILLLGTALTFFAGFQPQTNLVAAIIVWGLSELLVRRMRLVLPGILLSMFFLLFAFMAIPAESLLHIAPLTRYPLGRDLFDPSGFGEKAAMFARALVAIAACSLYYWRFRLPFSLLAIAGGLIVAALSLYGMLIGPIDETVRHLLLLICGIATFAAAMAFDLSDRLRVTRRSDCAFWLHLLAAPLIVHSLISFVLPQMTKLDTRSASIIVLMIAILALIAIVVDRRALLVSTLAYVGFVIAFAISRTGYSVLNPSSDGVLVFFVTLFVLGLFVILLGLGWLPVRRMVLGLVPSDLRDRLTPLPARA